MEEGGAPIFAVGFGVDRADFNASVDAVEKRFDAATSQLVTDASRIETATKNMVDTSGAVVQLDAFRTASTRAADVMARDSARIDRLTETRINALTRELSLIGTTREQRRMARSEELATEAVRVGNTDAATRIRALEAGIIEKNAEIERRGIETAAAERTRSHRQAMLQLGERAQLEAALERNTGLGRVSAVQSGATFSALAERERGLELAESTATAEREQIALQRQQILLLGERNQLEAAFARTMGTDRPRATDAGATFSALGAKLAEEEAQAVRSAELAHAMLQARVRQGVQEMREHEAATERDARALADLRAMIDPAASAQDRLNAELADARRVMVAAGMSAEEMTAAMDALWARSQRGIAQHGEMAAAARKSGFALQTIALQLPDITQGLLTGQQPFTVFIQQGFQIVQVAQMAEGGLRGFGKELVGLSIRFAPFLVALAAAGAGVALFNRWVNQGVTSEQLTSDLGKITGGADATKQELHKLKDATVSFGSTSQALFTVLGKDIAETFVGDMKTLSSGTKSVLDDLTSYGRKALASMYAGVAGMKAYLGEVEKGGVLGIGKMLIGQGDPALLDKTFGQSYRVADKYLGSLGGRVRTEAVRIERLKLAEKIGFNNPAKPKTDKHAEQLEREARAIEAQIKGLYGLADAYGVSGAAALIAEARVKAESDAIKKRGDMEAMVDRGIRLAVAQRVADGAKAAAAMRDQATIQTEVNTMVAAGLIPAERANELVRDRIADLPLLAAIEAAQQRGLKTEAERATAALKAQQDTRAAAQAASVGERFVAADKAADDRLAMLREELRLVGATDAERVKALATIKATQEAEGLGFKGAYLDQYVAKQVSIAVATEAAATAQRNWNDQLAFTADRWDLIAGNVQNAAQGMAESFGAAGRAIGDVASIYAGFNADRARLDQQYDAKVAKAGTDQRALAMINAQYALATSTRQIGLYGDMATAARGFFKEGSDGYKTLAVAEKTFRAVEFALSVRAMTQDAIETGSSIAKSGARAAADGVAAVAKALSSLPPPLNFAAAAATAAALAAIGISVAGGFGGGGSKPAPANTGTGTVFGDADAKSESLKRAIDQLREVDTVTSVYARQMATSLRSIDSQIGGFAAQIVRAGDVNASAGVSTGFKTNAIGSILGATPLIGGFIKSLFGTKTTVVGGGLYGGAQSVGDILAGGFDASTYSDVEKKKKFLGLTTSTKLSTVFGDADVALEQQFTLILRSFSDAIGAAAGPLGEAGDAVTARLNGFVLNIGKVDLKGLTGAEIQERLEAIFGAAADGMAEAALPGISRFQRAGEGAFETLVRVGSTVEAVDTAMAQLGDTTRAMSIDAKLGIADQFDAIGDLTSAVGDYFAAFYTPAEQTAARAAQLNRVFGSMNLTMPDTLAGFRSLVEAQNLNTEAGRATYAELLRLAPAFADLKKELEGAKSAADVAAERIDLERKLLELNGDTAALRALDLAKLDASNRSLQMQVWAVQDAQEAAKAAEQLRDAWTSVGDGIRGEIDRIRGLTSADTGGSFAQLLGRFNAANASARGGDMEAAKTLPQLSQALLTAAAGAATSRQELDRVQAQTAAQLEATYAAVKAAEQAASPSSTAKLLADAAATQAASAPAQAANDDMAAAVERLTAEVQMLREENRNGHAASASAGNRTAKVLERASDAAGGVALAVAGAAA